MASCRTSVQAFEEPAWRIFLDGGHQDALHQHTHTQHMVKSERQLWSLTAWLLLLPWSGRCHICAGARCGSLPCTASREAGTAEWSWQNICGGSELLPLHLQSFTGYTLGRTTFGQVVSKQGVASNFLENITLIVRVEPRVFSKKVGRGSFGQLLFPRIIRPISWARGLFIKLPAKSFLLLLEVCVVETTSKWQNSLPVLIIAHNTLDPRPANIPLRAAQDAEISGSCTDLHLMLTQFSPHFYCHYMLEFCLCWRPNV